MKSILKYQLLIEHYITKNCFKQTPKVIYDPINYILCMSGKRYRPSLCLLANEMFKGNISIALKPSIAFEFFHNFTLIHDDLMDKAPLRRGNPSVHKKWNESTAIISGDILLIKAYKLLESLDKNTFYKIVREFSDMGIKVCQGQQMDMNLEYNLEAIFEQYLQMITYKTAVLIGSALKVGALLAKADEKQANYLYKTGINIGIAFQMQDDLLDVFGQTKYVGKKYAGDICLNKKTILYFKALEKAKKDEKEELLYWYNIKTYNTDKIEAVKNIFKRLYVKEEVKKDIFKYKKKSLRCLSKVIGNEESKKILIAFLEESLSFFY